MSHIEGPVCFRDGWGWLGLIDGSLVIAGGIVSATGAGDSGAIHDLADPLRGPPVAIFWLWMIATSVVLFRRAPR
jgi:hypothetical protein